jgi:hypothetical protein
MPCFDRLLERALGDFGAHAASPLTSILPVTATEIKGSAKFLDAIDGLLDVCD